MWRSLSVARGDIVMFADADSTDFQEHFIYGTLGPLLTDPGIQFSKAAYRRPYTPDGRSVVDGGGRVTELMAKPLLNFYFPELTGFVQPLAGEFAAHRELLCSIPFVTGYGVEIAMMIDVLTEAGLPAMAQVDLEYRQNRHQPLWDLTRMSSAVLRALGRRVDVPEPERVPHAPEDVLALPRPDIYLHAVATENGLRLDEHLNEQLERPALSPRPVVRPGAGHGRLTAGPPRLARHHGVPPGPCGAGPSARSRTIGSAVAGPGPGVAPSSNARRPRPVPAAGTCRP